MFVASWELISIELCIFRAWQSLCFILEELKAFVQFFFFLEGQIKSHQKRLWDDLSVDLYKRNLKDK